MGESSSERTSRRGRRPAGQDARAAILAAARAEFTERGYVAASVRSVARRAGVDPGTVRHWYGDKARLLSAALGLGEISPTEIVRQAVEGPLDTVGERLLRAALTMWDDAGPEPLRIALPAVLSDPELRALMPQFLLAEILGPIARRLPPGEAALRANLLGTQMVGLMMARYVVGLEPIASLPADAVVAAVAPTLQRYLTGELPEAAAVGA
ncbi:TetR family transcriptional regulator [Myceligenerans pegani]|uniref:TetR family transcriptional regulator n=1 Tax=Myceligenerans pegani TaxID=2776917 RepID=A0ABR9N6I1_9MICO|nr:TetR family transcriptional regulator [Myceligenerans sp. TRM 65318]MBE1878632.1 TetR family transcriptional regulator [Myceligenerans sp. TRM 65318]MBE3020903.1 TetR family transcriptional regulator [Myceligenerans sp. TRM 65318]